MKTSQDLWAWEEGDELAVEDRVRELLDADVPAPPAPPAGLVPPPRRVTTEEVLAWIEREEDDPILAEGELELEAPVLTAAAPVPAPTPAPPASQDAVDAGIAEPAAEGPAVSVPPLPWPVLEPKLEPVRPRRRARHAVARAAYLAAVVAVAALAGAVAPQVFRGERPTGDDGPPAAPVLPAQQVVAWTVQGPGDRTFVAVLAAGVRPPVIVAVPEEVTINVPGQGIGTIGQAAATGDQELVTVALANLLGVPIHASVHMTLDELAVAVDAFGTVEIADRAMTGAEINTYLAASPRGELPEEPFLRWQDVLEGVSASLGSRPEAALAFPEPLRPVLAAGAEGPADLLALPVVDIGAGVLRPDQKALEALVEGQFVDAAGDDVRLVVLNGAGEPGVGEKVAGILVPQGFRLVSSANADRFGYRVTQIVATAEEDLPAAERARELLGVGRVLQGNQPLLADVIVVVGQDFTGGA